MANKMKKDGAVADSVSSQKTKTLNHNSKTNKEESMNDAEETVLDRVTVEVYDLKTGGKAFDTVDITPSALESSKEFMLKFAKEYQRNPHYPAKVLFDCLNEMRLEVELAAAEKKMTASQIYKDSDLLFQWGLRLLDNYSDNWQNANSIIEATMRSHCPKIQKRLDRYQIPEEERMKLYYDEDVD